MIKLRFKSFAFAACCLANSLLAAQDLKLNALEYLETDGLNVMLAHDFYPESHQGGVGVIQNGLRVATNGDLRLEPVPGQWQPVPKVGKRMVDKNTGEISVRMEYPDPEKNRKGFNPIEYPDLNMAYTVRIKPEGRSFRIIVDLDKPLPEEWVGRIGFNFELFPGILFGKSWQAGDKSGIFPRQLNGPAYKDKQGLFQSARLASGKTITIAPESDSQRMTISTLKGDTLELLDGRAQHNNGWFVVRSLVPREATTGAIEWLVSPNAIPGWTYSPVVQVSQVGYHPDQQKLAVIEMDVKDKELGEVELIRITEKGPVSVIRKKPVQWGKFLRYQYARLDFTSVKEPGMYMVKYGNYQTEPFRISRDIFKRDVWQPTLETFLPVQMCHMRINDRYKVWHGLCHMDDARMAPVNLNHFDGYLQGPSTLTKFNPGDRVPGLNKGGWHDAGDYDLRVESQAETMLGLSLAWEHFGTGYDNTTIDQKNHLVELHQPDGRPDILQQIEHGALSVLGGYKAMGRLYRGIICPTLRQYVLLGDAANNTDNQNYTGADIPVGLPGSPDDNWVFTEENPERELLVTAALAATSRSLKGFNDSLAQQSLDAAKRLWKVTLEKDPLHRLRAAVEMLITTKEKQYANFILHNDEKILASIEKTGWIVGPALELIGNEKFTRQVKEAVKKHRQKVDEQEKRNPYGIPYEPYIWGAGWGIQAFGVEQYFLHRYYPDIFPADYMLHAMNFILGCHPGSNTSSFASGIGSKSLTVAYGNNRDEWSYIPGGICSGTALIRPDYPELLTWPYLWQQTEYVLGGGTTDYLFLILAADKLLDK